MKESELLERSLALIQNLLEDDSEVVCEIVEEKYPGWCAENCNNLCRECIVKALEYYKKEGENGKV